MLSPKMKTLIVAIPALFIAAWVWAQFMSIERVGTTPLVRISWPGQGVLETSTNLRTWTASSITTSPHEVRTTTSPATFYRVRFFADTLITNAVVHTMNGAQPQAESIAILNGNIAFVGSNEHAEDLIGQQTSLIDAGGRVVLPGLHDAHLHVIEAGINADLCLLPQFGSAAQYRTALRQCLAGQPGTGWVFGAGVNMDNLLNTVASPLDLIDDEIPDRPAVIIDDLGHGAWANRLALAAVGFDLLTNDPPGGILDVDNMGNLSGVVFESAGQTLVDAAFPPTAANLDLAYQNLCDTLADLNSNGITSVSDAGGYWPRGHDLVWQRAVTETTLTVRASNALYVYPERPFAQQMTNLLQRFSNQAGALLRFNQAKIYIDGILSLATSALYDPYEPAVGLTPAEALGFEYFATNVLHDYVAQLEAAGFQIHFHVTGDRGAGLALDAIAEARTRNGITGRRHRLTHLYLVTPADRARFAPLGVFADFQLAPSSLSPGALADARFFVGATRMNTYLPAGSFFSNNVDMVLSSDYDADELSPFVKIETVLTRGTEGIPDVETAVRLMTIEPARLLHHEHLTGSIEPGKRADLILLDRNIFTIPTAQIGNTEVLLTLLEGREVYRRVGF